MAEEKTNEPEDSATAETEAATEHIGEDAILNEATDEASADNEATPEAPPTTKTTESDDDVRLKNLIEVHRSLAHTRGEDQEFEFAGRIYKVFQDGVVQIVQTDEPE